jgi:3-dehydroquinate synthase
VNSIQVSGEQRYSVDFVDNWVVALEEAIVGRQAIILYPESLRSMLSSIPTGISQISLPDGERQKDLGTFIRVLDEIARLGLTRSGVVIGIGGGATTDLTGFVAATYLRGVEWIAVPTSLAGMVDASIGGKTGINLATGKNLAGAFHSPSKVIVDLTFLKTLSERDLNAGMAEVVKCGFVADLKILDLMSENWRTNLPELIHRAISVKADVVSRDFKESFHREILNYGHTLGHAIEKHSNYQLRHGECVSIGLVFAAELSRKFSGLSRESAVRHTEILSMLSLPTTYEKTAWVELYQIMQSDKKKRANLRFVTLSKMGEPTRLEDTNEAQLKEIYEGVVGR